MTSTSNMSTSPSMETNASTRNADCESALRKQSPRIGSWNKSERSVMKANLLSFVDEIDVLCHQHLRADDSRKCDAPPICDTDYQMASSFLHKHHLQVDEIENDLFRATEYILPNKEKVVGSQTPAAFDAVTENTTVTITELSHMISRLQELQQNQINQLEKLLGIETNFNERSSSTPMPLHHPCHLDSVIETDNETDGTTSATTSSQCGLGTTPSPYNHFASPPFSYERYSTSHKSRGTPVTPKLGDLFLSESTSSVLKHEEAKKSYFGDILVNPTKSVSIPAENDELNKEQVKSFRTIQSEFPLYSNVICEEVSEDSSETRYSWEDDGTLRTTDTKPTAVAKIGSERFTGRSPVHQRINQVVHDSNTDGTNNYQDIVRNESLSQRIGSFDNDDSDDDSAIYCATIVANESRYRSRMEERIKASPKANFQNESSLKKQYETVLDYTTCSYPDITIIEVDPTKMDSLNETNMTMDSILTFPNDIAPRLQLETVYEDKKVKTIRDRIAPIATNSVLDCFRVDCDDTSPHGFRVVPKNGGFFKDRQQNENEKENKKIFFNRSEDITRDNRKGSKSFLSATHTTDESQTKQGTPKVYRKTPLPKEKKRFLMSDMSSSTASDVDQATLNSNYCSPLQHSNLDQRMCPDTETITEERRPLASVSSLRYADRDFLASYDGDRPKERSEGKLCHDGATTNVKNASKYSSPEVDPHGFRSARKSTLLYSSGKSFYDQNRRKSCINRDKVTMRTVFQDEYDLAPDSIRMQIALRHVQTACDAFSYAMRCKEQEETGHTTSSVNASVTKFTEMESHQLLRCFKFTDSMYRSNLLFGLCYFHRLSMAINTNGEVVFDIIQNSDENFGVK